MEWTWACWQTGCKEDIRGKARQKYGVQEKSASWSCMTTLGPNKYGRSMETHLSHLVAGTVAHITLSLSCRVLCHSFCLSLCLRCLEGEKKQIPRACKYVRRRGWTEVQDVIGENLCFNTMPCLHSSANLSGSRLMLYLGDVRRHCACVSLWISVI